MNPFIITEEIEVASGVSAVVALEATGGQAEFFLKLRKQWGLEATDEEKRIARKAEAKEKLTKEEEEYIGNSPRSLELMHLLVVVGVEGWTGEKVNGLTWPPLTSVEAAEERRNVARMIPQAKLTGLGDTIHGRIFISEEAAGKSAEPSGSSTSTATSPPS